MVVYFYPAAFTQGCTVEAHEFAAAMPQYQALGASVIGVSHDDIATLNKFSVSECQSKFPVAADQDRHIMKSYDATLGFLTAYASRTSYVVSQDGKIAFAYSDLDPDEHVSRTLKAVQALSTNCAPLQFRKLISTSTPSGSGTKSCDSRPPGTTRSLKMTPGLFQAIAHRLKVVAPEGDMVEGPCPLFGLGDDNDRRPQAPALSEASTRWITGTPPR